MNLENALADVLKGLVSSFDEKTINTHSDVYRVLQQIREKVPSHFTDMVQSFHSDLDTLAEHAMNITDAQDTGILPFIVNGLYKHFHTHRIEQIEGSSCSYDKSSFIESMTLKALEKQENLSLYDDYQHVEQIKEDKERKAYWSPTSVKDTDEAIALFWNWYYVKDAKATSNQ